MKVAISHFTSAGQLGGCFVNGVSVRFETCRNLQQNDVDKERQPASRLDQAGQGDLFGGMQPHGATFSICRKYRYALWRHWNTSMGSAMFLMLNPSTADEVTNDPTVERCQRRAIAMGYGGLIVCNLFGLRSTDPKALYAHGNPIGDDNDEHILNYAKSSKIVICAWGQHGRHLSRGKQVLRLLHAESIATHALRVNADGSPAHPLYTPYSASPIVFNTAARDA